MKTNIINNSTDPCINDEKHSLVPARKRGAKVRFRCNVCTRLTGWQKVGTVKNPIANVVSKENEQQVMDATFWNDSTVADLKKIAKDRGITGYSKMKREDLLDVLGTNA